MAVNTTTLFTRIGRLGRLLYALHSGQAGMAAAFSSLYSTFGSAYPDLDGSVAAQEDNAVRSVTGWWGTPAAAVSELITRTVKADNPAAARSTTDALVELRRQMIAANTTVQAATVAVNTAALSGSIGTGVVVTSTKRGDGRVQEHAAPEAAKLVCTADSYSGGATSGREQFAYIGEPQEAGRYDFDWPTGSDAATGLTAVSPAEDGSSTGNLLTNGDFEDWSGSPLQLDYWGLGVGTWNTHVVQNTTAYRGTYAAKFVAGATLSVLYTQFGSSDSDGLTAGTPPTPKALTSYAVNFWARTASGTASGGVFTVELTDDSGTVTADAQSVNNSFTLNANTLNTTWTSHTGVFRLPAAPPAAMRLRLRVSTALAGADVLVDDFAFTPLVAAYPGGPGLAVFSGATSFQANDGWTVTTTNDYGGGSYGATFNHLLYRVYGDPNYLLPTAGSPTLADTLLTAP